MQIHDLEIVTKDVDAVCAAYAASDTFAVDIQGDIRHGLWPL